MVGPRELKPAITSPGLGCTDGAGSNFACAVVGLAFAQLSVFTPLVRPISHDGIVTSAACTPAPIVATVSPFAAAL